MSENIDHLSIQPTSVIDAVMSPLPDPPVEFLRIPGMMQWWSGMKLARERDKETLYRLILTKISGGIAGEASSGLNRFSVIGRSVINANGTINNQTTSTTGGTGGSTSATTVTDDEDARLLAWSGL